MSHSLVHENFLNDKSKPVNNDLVEAVNFIIENVFLKRHMTINLLTAVEDARDPYYLDLKRELMHKNTGFCMYRLNNHTYVKGIRFRLKLHNIFLLDTFQSFLILVDVIQPNKFNFDGFYLFVLINGYIEEIDKIFHAMWKKGIVNVSVIFDKSGVIQLVTFRPFKRTACGDTTSIYWDKFENGTFAKGPRYAFPDKLTNLYECPIRVVTFERCPAVCRVTKGKETSIVGFDMDIINLLGQTLNFTVDRNFLQGEEQWGIVYPNGTATGAIKKIQANESDIAIGNYLLRANRVATMDNSIVYFSFPVVFAIPPGTRLSPFEKLLRPFEIYVWICLLFTLSVGVLVILVLNYKLKGLRAFVYGTGIKTPIMNMLVAICGETQTKLPKRNFSRFLLMMFLLFCLVKRNVYQGALYIFLQSDGRHKEVQSIDEMIEQGFEFYMFESYTDIVASQPKVYNR